MKILMKQTFAILLLVASLQPAQALACSRLTPEAATRERQALIESAKSQAIALRDEADLVFVGVLTKMMLSGETTKDNDGRHVNMQLHRAQFLALDTIKGSSVKGQVLEYSLNKNLVVVSCGGTPFRESLPRENGEGERYLVYAKAGKILRTNHIPTESQVLSGTEEARHIR